MSKKPKIIFISESIRRDSHAPMRFFKELEVVHLYLNAPYGDMSQDDLEGARQVKIENLLQELIAEKPDIIQGAEPFGSRLSLKLANICLKACQKTGAKLVVPILENRPLSERFNLVQRAVLRAFCPGYFKFASAVVVLNKGAKVNVKAYAKNAKIIEGIVWGVWGVDTDLFKKIAEKEKNSLIYVGRLVEDKGLKYMLEGFAKSCEKISDLKLRLAGRGDYEEQMRSFIKERNLESNVEFLGLVKNTDLPKYFSKAELCIYPSITMKRWEEQVGTVNFQAMACETPVVTTKSGAIPEYIKDGEGAFLVKEKSAEAISVAVLDYFSDRKRMLEVQKRARNFVMRYDIRSEIAKAEKLLLEIIK